MDSVGSPLGLKDGAELGDTEGLVLGPIEDAKDGLPDGPALG